MPELALAGPVPLTPAQAGILFTEKLFEGSGLFNVLTEIDIEGDLHLPSLLRALEHTLRAHPALTARPVERDGVTMWVDTPCALRQIVRIVDFEAADPSRHNALREQLAAHEQNWFFDGACAWLRVTIVRFSASSWLLMLCRHHIASDGWSFAIISREVQQAYRHHRHGASLQHVDAGHYWNYCRFMQQASQSADGLRHWSKVLAGAPREIRLPRLRRPDARISSVDFVRFDVAKAPFAALQSHKITGYVALLAIFALVLHEESEQSELCIGTDVTTRDRPEWERMVGMFVNRVVLRISLDPQATLLEFLRETQKTVLSALTWRHTALDGVARRLGAAGGTGLFNVIFGLHNNPHEAFELDSGVQCRIRQGGVPCAEVDLSLYFMTAPDLFRGVISYRDECFERAWVQRLTQRFADLSARIGDILHEPLHSVLSDLRSGGGVDASLLERWQSVYGDGAALSFTEKSDG